MASKQASKKTTTRSRAPRGATATSAKKNGSAKPKATKAAPKTAAKKKPAAKARAGAASGKSSTAKRSTAKKPAKSSSSTLHEMERLLRKKPEVTSYDTYGYALEAEEDYFVAPERGVAYGRCGGRNIQSLMEKRICDKLSRLGVAHSHRPRRYEVKIGTGQIAAYSPCIVLRGRGREGKTAIIEVLAELDLAHIRKIQAFRALYESEFYVIFAAPGVVFDKMPPDAYDEAVLPAEVASLVARLAE